MIFLIFRHHWAAIFFKKYACKLSSALRERRWITNSSERAVLSIVSRRLLSVWHLSPLSLIHFKVHQSRARRFHARHWFLLPLSRPFPASTRAAIRGMAGLDTAPTDVARCLPPPYPRSTHGCARRKPPRGTTCRLPLLLPSPTDPCASLRKVGYFKAERAAVIYLHSLVLNWRPAKALPQNNK